MSATGTGVRDEYADLKAEFEEIEERREAIGKAINRTWRKATDTENVGRKLRRALGQHVMRGPTPGQRDAERKAVVIAEDIKAVAENTEERAERVLSRLDDVDEERRENVAQRCRLMLENPDKFAIRGDEYDELARLYKDASGREWLRSHDDVTPDESTEDADSFDDFRAEFHQ